MRARRGLRASASRVGSALLLSLGLGAPSTLGAGCLDAQRKPHCEAFVVAADACYARAGLDPFFAQNVNCEEPLSTVPEYKCLLAAYEDAACADAAEAHAAVDAASLDCLGWNGDLASDGDDDSSDPKAP